MVEDIYKAEKCEYTGMPIFTQRCDCYIHRMRREVVCPTPRVRRSRSHELLQIEPPVTEDDIKKAYHKMCLVHHPDKGGDQQKFIEIKNAYDELLVC